MVEKAAAEAQGGSSRAGQANLNAQRAKQVVKKMKESGCWPVSKPGEWKDVYKQMFEEELKPKTDAYNKVKRAVENAKA